MAISTYAAARTVCEASHWSVSNLRIQKIIYLASMAFMSRTGGPLVFEPFEAWDYGPVLPDLYSTLKMYGARPVRYGFYRTAPLEAETREGRELEQACAFLLKQPPSRLIDFTQREDGAWARNYIPGKRAAIIPNDHIIEEGRTLFGARTVPGA
ncbi:MULTISPECIES: Panacea domain-containing protein [Haematospirillum]|uniref:Panacea domain-containing protein n=1 Tax=Haematospirillum TaxID=1804663 RepID=UPI0014330F02|nr:MULTISPECIES: type II toxin-antitoxin system antitoxin SocA domain-containing protein [Haematospirillum]NKD44995.1 DUF4065 domain-containing protein [Haematospirillum jordaniae]NKD55160.1 DUF4065 domain-containing protein [Haematospirillum sp. H4890]NKD75413.1 DUF4065 domain-containing protein [Haematospirillum sp. H4485]NKD81598.1 DUF4065 domain-containing protein [Haematospirillum jordaniae]NKD84403.1 DUF4065 domain-containing protein [Haematospirillum jordaniae]